MRKYMTKVVTQTVAKCAKMKISEQGNPIAVPMEDVTLIGNYPLERARREVREEYGENVVVLSVKATTLKYEMAVEDFILLATPVPDTSDSREG